MMKISKKDVIAWLPCSILAAVSVCPLYLKAETSTSVLNNSSYMVMQNSDNSIHLIGSFTCAGTCILDNIGQPKPYNVSEPAVEVSYMPVQYAYAASMDIDLAPKIDIDKSQDFDSDGFVPLDGNLKSNDNVNDSGFRNEDFSYALPEKIWKETRTINDKVEYQRDTSPENSANPGLMIWGHIYADNTGRAYFSNYLPQEMLYASNVYHPRKEGKSVHDEGKHWKQEVSHYRMFCSIGSSITVLMVNGVKPDAVKLAKERRADLDSLFDKGELIQSPSPKLRNVHYQLSTGILEAE